MDDNVKNPNKKKLVYIAIPIVVFVLVLICIGPLQKASKYNRALSEIESLSTRQEGIDLLKTLPENYKDVAQILDAYELCLNCPFEGHYLYTSGDIKFDLTFYKIFDDYDNTFQIRVEKERYYTTGEHISDDTWYVNVADIDNNTIEREKYKWIWSSSGLTEEDCGDVLHYTKVP